jgi:hypothetical protein
LTGDACRCYTPATFRFDPRVGVTALPIEKLLTERRSQFLAQWLASAGLAGREYTSSGTAALANPVPVILQDAYAEVYDCLCGPSLSTGPALARLMRLRALDGPEVEKALAFLSTLKALLHENMAPLLENPAALTDLDARIETLAAEAARHFAASCQLLIELRQREVLLRTAKLAERLRRRPTAERTGP